MLDQWMLLVPFLSYWTIGDNTWYESIVSGRDLNHCLSNIVLCLGPPSVYIMLLYFSSSCTREGDAKFDMVGTMSKHNL